ncbi:LPXTG cell wall anchor domain-containing protein [Micromonospora sp. NPDC050686]|uniref:LPXTG cell wall anchor domain-containing protein n=1 Tax=Micromonospora sp. NPDC050686 TaxID=3154631 RepID=UPI0033C09117
MFRSILTGAVAVAALACATPALAAPAPASAEPTPAATTSASPVAAATATAIPADAPIQALPDLVFLSGDPWSPTDDLGVTVRNTGSTPARGWFLVQVPTTLAIGTGDADCRALPGEGDHRALCGGKVLTAGGSRTYHLKLRSTARTPIFDRSDWGAVTGRTDSGVSGLKREFRINWPSRTALRLTGTVGPQAGATVTVTVRVTNLGDFAVSAYSLLLRTDSNLLTPSCRRPSREGDSCEIYREAKLAAGATDTVRLRFRPTSGMGTLRLQLAPAQRYTNRDTTLTLTLPVAGGPSAGPSASPSAGPSASPSASPSPRLTTAPGQAAGGGTGDELARTGANVTTYALIGGGLVALGGALLLLLRRRLAA